MAQVENKELWERWSIEDVRSVSPGISDEDAVRVMEQVSEEFDAEIGINWGVIKECAKRVLAVQTESPDEG